MLSDISLLAGTCEYFYKEFMRGDYFKTLDFILSKGIISSSTMFSKISYAGTHLTSIKLPPTLKQTDYKK